MPTSIFDTHDVYNQPPLFPIVNGVETDPVLVGALEHALDQDTEAGLLAFGAFWGSHEAHEWARLATTTGPQLQTHDAQGRRIDIVEFHPAYHALMRRSAEAGLSVPPVVAIGPAQAHTELLRLARLYLAAQTEPGHLISFSTTRAAGAALEFLPDPLAAPWLERLRSRRYDYRPTVITEKTGLSIGLGLTEKQGGVDPLDTTTVAVPTSAGHYRLTGHKWFLSSPMSDASLMLAEAPGGPTAFLVPRLRASGALNDVRIVRLKPTLGLRASAIAEFELADAEGYLVGDEGDGPSILKEALARVRLDATCVAAGQMRGVLAHAVHHCRHRAVAGDRLVDLDLMTRVLADMALDVAGATVLAMRLAAAADAAPHDPFEAAYLKLILPAAKYWIAKSGVAVAAESLECVGGNGYIETGLMPRFYRDAPGNGLWGGPGNVMALELIDVLANNTQALDAIVDELSNELGRDGAVSADVIRAAAKVCLDDRGSARILIEQLALAATAAALHRYSPRAITGAFVETRLSGPWRASYGMLDARYDSTGIVDYVFHGL